MRVFKDIGLVEQLGSGMSRILSAYDKSIFEFTPNFLIVTFPFNEGFTLPSGVVNGNVNLNSDKITNALSENPNLKLDDISLQTGIPKRTISRELKKMQENQVIKRVGSDKSGYWEFIQDQ